ncbi:MAG: hypothetical protein WAZ18_07475 [Alphaproteobacteria bacterium]
MVMAAKSLDETLEILMDFATRCHNTTLLADVRIQLDKPLPAKDAGDLIGLAKEVSAANCYMSFYVREFLNQKRKFWTDKRLMVSELEDAERDEDCVIEITQVSIGEVQRIR